MKQIGQAVLVGMFVLLFLLSCQALVEQPEIPKAPQTASLPRHTALTCPESTPPLQLQASETGSGRVNRHALLTSSADAPLTPMPVSDGNGRPLRRQSYVRTVYTACRLEESAG